MKPQATRQKPLAGVTVMVTRPKQQAARLADLLVLEGASVVLQPVIEIVETGNWAPFDQAIASFDRYSRVVLVSANAARFFFSRIAHIARANHAGIDLAQVQFAAIGAATATECMLHGVQVDLVPKCSDSASLAALLLDHPTAGQTMVIRADRGSAVLGDCLRQSGYPFEQFALYHSRDATEVAPEVLVKMHSGMIDWTTVTSSAIGASLLKLFGADRLANTRLASISPTTTAALEAIGLTASAEASLYNMQGLVDAIVTQTHRK